MIRVVDAAAIPDLLALFSLTGALSVCRSCFTSIGKHDPAVLDNRQLFCVHCAVKRCDERLRRQEERAALDSAGRRWLMKHGADPTPAMLEPYLEVHASQHGGAVPIRACEPCMRAILTPVKR